MSQDEKMKSGDAIAVRSSEDQTARELPRYRSHKEVWALKIKSIECHKPTIEELDTILNGAANVRVIGAIITPEDDRYAPFAVDDKYVQKHDPQPGGYYVRYADGYESWSPAQAFEEGYTPAS